MKNRSKRYSLEFKQSLVALFNDEKLVSVDGGKPITRKDFLKLKKEYENLKEENEILKAAAMILGKK
ncbi:transposase [Fructilactobacillus sanfranciscensis]|uniref:transposase n=1 Tax=Fructilactobacillus sanfranciscensis TaxID=1625 RepID=UPI0025C87EF9|nr:transposase [Fructilactobacillus sanfranciscensis]MDN4462277.1 transposase [Fructilactobacillus sanfranciscensis]